jgi:hypothetical protein
MTKHTPGPWYWDEDMPMLKSQDGRVCDFGNNEAYFPTEGVPPNEADSRLIAAAPELLHCLEVVLCHTEGDAALESIVHADHIRAAIAKATGGAAW